MAHDAKYGRVTVEHEPGNPLGDDEPVFLLRARDATAVSVLYAYAAICAKANSPTEHVDAVEDLAETFREWQTNHIDLVKTPD